MEFRTVQEAFNHYRTQEKENLEKRAQDIKTTIETDPDADAITLKVEAKGIEEALNNLNDKTQDNGDDEEMNERQQFNPITGTNFNQTQTPKGDVFESPEYRNAFYKTLLGQKLDDVEQRTFNQAMEQQEVERRADDFNTTTDSAAVLPTETLNEVIAKARKQGGLIEHVRSFNIPTNISVPIGTPATKAQWHTEGEQVEGDKVETVAVEFNGYEILKVFSISAAAKKMSIQAFEAYLIDELTNAVMAAIADALVNGTGNKQGTGLEKGITWNASNKIEYAKDGNPEYTDFTKSLAILKRGYAAGAKFAMSNATLYNHVYSLVDGNGRPLFIQDPQNESIGHILGKEVIVDDNIEDGTIILGNFEYMGYNLPEGLMLEVSRESSFRSGLVDYRAMAIADTKPLVKEAFVKLVEATA